MERQYTPNRRNLVIGAGMALGGLAAFVGPAHSRELAPALADERISRDLAAAIERHRVAVSMADGADLAYGRRDDAMRGRH